MQFTVVGPAFGAPGDEVSVIDGISPGDVIQFVRVGPAELELRLAAHGPEQRYRVERGEEAGSITLYAVDDAGPFPGQKD